MNAQADEGELLPAQDQRAPSEPERGCIDRSGQPWRQRCFETFSLLVDQDFFLDAYPGSLNEDRNYTMGVALQFQGAFTEYLPTYYALQGLDWLFGLEEHLYAPARVSTDAEREPLPHKAGFLFGNSAFTPDDLGAPIAIEGDRPYASMLYFTSTRNALIERDRLAIHSEFTFGLLGLDISRPVQTAIHRAVRGAGDVDPKDPRGWHHQVSDGGEPTLRYGVGAKRLLSEHGWFDLSALGELNAGSHTNVAAGLSLRLGFISTPFWGFASNPVGFANQVLAVQKPQARKFDLYLFATLRERVVAYNVMLQGQFRHSDVRVAARDVERLITEYEAGLVVGWPRWITLTLVAIAGRTPEYEGAQARAHRWASLYLTIGGVP